MSLILGHAVAQYRRLIDTTVDYAAAERALRAALRGAVRVAEAPQPDGTIRLRAAARRGAAWSRCYLLVNTSFEIDVLGVQPASPARAPRTSPHGRAADAPPPRTAHVDVRLSDRELAEIRRAASEESCTTSDYVRTAALERARGDR